MSALNVTYRVNAAGTALELNPTNPAQRVITIGTGVDKVQFTNNAGSDITIESIPRTCSAFDKPDKLMSFKVKDGKTVEFALRQDLDGAFINPGDVLRLLWKATADDGKIDPTPLVPTNPFNFQILIEL